MWYGNCPRCSLHIAEDVCVDYKVLLLGSDRDSDTNEKINGNIEAFHVIGLVARILSSRVLCHVFHVVGTTAIFITNYSYGNLHKP